MILETRKNIEIGKILLVDRDDRLRDRFDKVLTADLLAREDHLLSALLRLAKEPFDLVCVRLANADRDMEAALKSFRRVAKSSRLILLAEMLDEPRALSLVQRGLADDYLILPLYDRDVEQAVRKWIAPPVSRPAEPARDLPTLPPAAEIASDTGDPQQLIVREVSDLIQSAELGLKNLLERICWSAVFLCKAQGARIVLGSESARVGRDDAFDLQVPLRENGRDIGTLDLATGTGQISCSLAGRYLEQLIPGLVRLASSHGRLQELANTDELTGLANRRFFQETLENLIGRARQERSRVTLVIFDFDDFKHYNDAYGHGAGDEILRESGMLVKRCIRRQDLAARYGGDEFAVVLWDWQERRTPNSEHPRSATAIMQRFRKLLREHYFSRLGPQAQGALTISGGLASFPWDAASVQELIERADQALLEAKRSGKDRLYLVGQGCEESNTTR